MQLLESGRADANLHLVPRNNIWNSQLILVTLLADSGGVVSSKQIVPDLGLGPFLALIYVFLR